LRLCCSSPAGFCQSRQRCSLISRSPSIERLSGSSLRTNKWPEKVVLDTSQLTVKPPVIMDPPVIRPSIPPPSDKAPDLSNLEAMALLKPDTHCKSNAAWQGPLDRGASPEVSLQTGERKWTGALASLGGLVAVNQARMLCRPGPLRRHGPWIDLRSIGGKLTTDFCWCARKYAATI
jgi:hypothetical protein